MLSAHAVAVIVTKLTLEDDGVFIVGGQALNIWAERYARRDERLLEFGPYTSKDIDYFGYRQAAEKLADALNGTVRYATLEDHTPEAAIVDAIVDGEAVSIDFVTDVVGVRSAPLQRNAAVLTVPYRTEAGQGRIDIPVMHPLHCFQSRVANVLRLDRREDLGLRQLHASPLVLAHYIDDVLKGGDFREAQRTLQDLHVFLTTDMEGKLAHMVCRNDPLEIFDRFADDARLPTRFRTFNMTRMSRNIRGRRKPGDRVELDP